QYREARTTHVPEFSAAEVAYAEARAVVERVRTEIKALRKEARRRAEGTELRAKLTEAVQARRRRGQRFGWQKRVRPKARRSSSPPAELTTSARGARRQSAQRRLPIGART